MQQCINYGDKLAKWQNKANNPAFLDLSNADETGIVLAEAFCPEDEI